MLLTKSSYLYKIQLIVILMIMISCDKENINSIFSQQNKTTTEINIIPNRLSFDNYSTEEGLPENSAFNISEDYIGNLWVTTQNGIARFSNNKFVSYTNSSVDSNTVFSKYNSITFLKDSSLIAYSNRGVAIYNQKKDVFERILTAPKEAKFQDKQDENNQIDYDDLGYWYQSTQDSLYKCVQLDGTTHQFEIEGRIHQKVSFSNFSIIQTILADQSHIIYRVSINQSGSNIEIIAKSPKGRSDIEAINGKLFYYISNDSLFHSSNGYQPQLPITKTKQSNHLFYNSKDSVLTLFSSNDSTTSMAQLKENRIKSNPVVVPGSFLLATQMNNGELLVLCAERIGKYKEFRIYKTSENNIELIKTNLDQYFRYYNRLIRSVYFDERGHLFIGTWTYGIYHTDVKENNHFKYELKTDELVFPFYENNNTLYTYTKTGLFYEVNLLTGIRQVIYKLSNNAMVFACKRFNDDYYFAVGKNGYLTFNIKSKTFNDFEVNQPSSDKQIIVTNLCLDSQERVWLVSAYNKSNYSVLKLDGNQTKWYKSSVSDTTISDKRVMDVFEYKGAMYFTAQAYGTHHYNETTEHFTCFEENEEIQCSRAVIVRDGKIWCSTFTSGIAHMSYPNRKVEEVFSRENGLLPISWINQFTFLSDSIIIIKGDSPEWYLLNIKNKSCTVIPNYEESFWSKTFNVVQYQSNLTIMPSTGGVVVYDFEKTTVPDILLIHLKSLSVNDVPLVSEKNKTLDKVIVSHDQNNLSIELQNIRPVKQVTHFKYRVIDYVDNWTSFDINSPIKLSNLSHGLYTLEIQMEGQNNELSEIRSILTIEVAKPWWQTLWFYVSLTLFILLIGYSLFRLKTQQLRKRQLLLERKVDEATHELLVQKKVIEDSHQELGIKHKEIKDSINYAERIQRSFLATKTLLDDNLKDYFVLFEPKDVVSGDFYWANTLNNGSFSYVTGDSTGHGVPGAIMSILNITSLEKAIENESNPAKILNTTREIIIERLKNDGSAEGGKDGMDCTFLTINPERTQISFSSAHNPVWLVRGEELIEFKGDKFPVGKHDRDSLSFTLQEFDIQKGDQIYTITDGFYDQFGGAKGKKFMVKNMKQYILSLRHLSMQEQQIALLNKFKDWKGNIEQLDDVCVIGIRI